MYSRVTLLCVAVSSYFVNSRCDCDLKKFKESGFVPNIVLEIPQEELQVWYSESILTCGQQLDGSVVGNKPQVKYAADSDKFYTIMMIDPDAPEPQKPIYANFLHWFVVNIPGANVEQGKVLVDYMAPRPPTYSDAHRYFLLVFRQSSFIRNPSYTRGRTNFNVTKAAKRMKLANLVAGNFFHYARH